MPIDKSLTAEDIMTAELVAFPESTSVLEATQIMLDRKISGAPVLDKDGKLVGVLSEEDLIGVFYEGHRDLSKTAIGDCSVLGSSLVTRRVVTAKATASAVDLTKTMMIKKIKRLPIVDEERKLVGIVTRKNILRAMASRSVADA